jgi:hypothetical protein
VSIFSTNCLPYPMELSYACIGFTRHTHIGSQLPQSRHARSLTAERNLGAYVDGGSSVKSGICPTGD